MNNQNKHYLQLTLEQRYHIGAMLEIGSSVTAIGLKLRRHRSSISREILRNSSQGRYCPKTAQKLSDARRSHADKASKRNVASDSIIAEFLSLGWSPEAIGERMRVECASEVTLSHCTIYKRIEDNKAEGGRLYRQLPRFGKSRWKGGKRKHNGGAKLIPNRVDISKRPKVIESRSRLGDWEGDLVHGQSVELVTLVDRTSRFTLAKRVPNKTKYEVADMIISLLGSVGSRETLTLDNGGEFSDHERIAEKVGVDIYFAKPYASWQRGTNENTNGRLRRVWPKKFDMSKLTDREVDEQVLLLNLTPRKVLNGLTPFEVFTGSRVALIT